MSELRVLNLGAGKQSTVVYLMAHRGEIAAVDWAIFADPQEENRLTYEHLAWLRGINDPPILTGTAGKLGDHLIAGTVGTGGRKRSKVGLDGTHRFASIPAYTAQHHDRRAVLVGCEKGQVRRQCTKEYKIEVVDRVIRRQILGLRPHQRIPKDTAIVQLFGISCDEKYRADAIRKRFDDIPWGRPEFPLIDMGWRRGDCEDYIAKHVPHPVPRSACVFCPYRSNSEWLNLKATDPEGWARAVEIDRALRPEGTVVNRGMDQSLYLHRKCIPLEMVDLEKEAARERAKGRTDLFKFMCSEGMCGL